MFLLADGTSGIYCDFIFYTGKADKPHYGFCTDVSLELCETVPSMINQKVYFDNYFTIIRLQVELMKKGIFAVDTVRKKSIT